MASMKSLSRDPLTEWERMVKTNIESMQGSCPFLADTRFTRSGCAVLNSTLDNFSQEGYQKTVNSDDKIIFRDILGKDTFAFGCNKMETFQHLEKKRDAENNIDYDDKHAGRRISEEKRDQIIENEEWSCTNLDSNNESYPFDSQKHMHTHIKSVDWNSPRNCINVKEYVDTFDGVFLNKHVGGCENSEFNFQLFTLDPSLIISDTTRDAKGFLGGVEITGTYIHMTDQTAVDTTVEECTSFGESVEISEVQPHEERFGGYINEECVTEKLSFKSCMKTNMDTIQTDELNCFKKELSSTGDLCSRRISAKDVSNNKICSTELSNRENKTRHFSNERMKINYFNNAETSSINLNIGKSRARDFTIASMTGISSSAVPTDCALKAKNVTPVEIDVQYGRALCCDNDHDASQEIQLPGVTVVESEWNLVKDFSCGDGFSQEYSSLENRQADIVGSPLHVAGLYKQNRMQKWSSEENIVVGNRRRRERKCRTNIGKSGTFDIISFVDVEMPEHFISRARSTGEGCKSGHIKNVGYVSGLHTKKDPTGNNKPQPSSLNQFCTNGGSEAEACTKGNKTEACTKSNETGACTKDSETEACTQSTETEACTKGTETEACTKGNETEACTKGNETEVCTKGNKTEEYKSCKKSKYLTRNPVTQWKRLVDMNLESMLNSTDGDVHRAGYGGGDFEVLQLKAKDCCGITLEKTTVELEPSLNRTPGLTSAELDTDRCCQSFVDVVISKDEDVGKDECNPATSLECLLYETVCQGKDKPVNLDKDDNCASTVITNVETDLISDCSHKHISDCEFFVEKDILQDLSYRDEEAAEVPDKFLCLQYMESKRDLSNEILNTTYFINSKPKIKDQSSEQINSRTSNSGNSSLRALRKENANTRDFNKNGKANIKDLTNGRFNIRDQSNQKGDIRDLNSGNTSAKYLSKEKACRRDLSNEKSSLGDLSNEKSSSGDLSNEKSSLGDLSNEKSHTSDPRSKKSHTRDLSNGKSHTRDVSNGKSHTRDVSNGKSHTRDQSNGKSHTRDQSNQKSHSRNLGNGKSHTRDLSIVKNPTRDLSNGKSHTRDLSLGKNHSRDLSNGKSHTRDLSNEKSHTRDLSNGKSHTRDLSNGKSHTRGQSNKKPYTKDLSNGKSHTRDLSNIKSHTRDLSTGENHTRDLSNGKSHTRDLSKEKSHTIDLSNRKSSMRDLSSGKPSRRDLSNGESHIKEPSNGQINARDMSCEKPSSRDLSNEKPHLKELINKQSSTKDVSNSKLSRRDLGNVKAGIEDLSNEKSNTRYVSSIQSSTRDPSNGKTTAINVGNGKISTAVLGNGKTSTKDKSTEKTILGDHSKGRNSAKNLVNFKVNTGESNKCSDAEKCIKSSNTDKASLRNLSKEKSYTENITSRKKNLGNLINAVAKTWDQSCTNVSARDLSYKETSTRNPSEDRTSVREFNNGITSQRDLGNGTVSAKDLGNIADDISCFINCQISQVGQNNVKQDLSKDTANVKCPEIQLPGVSVVEGEWNLVKDFSCGDGFSQRYSSLENRQTGIVGSPLLPAGLYKQNRVQKCSSRENIVVGSRRRRERKCKTNIGKSGTFDIISSVDVEIPEHAMSRARSTGEGCKSGHIKNVGYVSGLHTKKDPTGNNKPQPSSLNQFCTKGGSEAEACTKRGSETESCTKGNETEACTKGNETKDCTKGNETEACTKGNETEACTKGNETEACIKGNQTEACTKGNETEACTKGNRTEACTNGNDTEACTKGNETEASTKGNETEACTKGNETEACTKGNETEACTKGNRTEACTKGNDTETCTKGNETEACTKGNKTEEYKSCKKSKHLTRNPMTQWKRLVDMNVESMLNSTGEDVHRAGYGGGDFEVVQSKAKDCCCITLEKTVELEPLLHSTSGLTAAECDIDKWCQSFDDISKDEDVGKEVDDATMSPEYFSYETFISPTVDFPKNEVFLEVNNDIDILCSTSFFGQEAPKVIKELENPCEISQESSQCEMNLCVGNSDEIFLLDSKASMISLRNPAIGDLSISKIPQLCHDKADFKQKEIEETNTVFNESDSGPRISLALTGGKKSFVEMNRMITTPLCFKEDEGASTVITNMEIDSISNYSQKHISELNRCEKDTIRASGFYDKGHAKWPGKLISLEQIESSLDKCNRTEGAKCDLPNTGQCRPTYNLDVVKQIKKINYHNDVPSDQLTPLQVKKCCDQISNNFSTKCTSADVKVIEVLDELELPSEIDNKPPVWSRFSSFMRNIFGSSSKEITQEVNDISQTLNAKKCYEEIQHISTGHTKKSNAVLEAVKNNSHSQNVNNEQKSFSKENDENIGASYEGEKQDSTSISNRSLPSDGINTRGQTKLAPNSLFPDIADSEICSLNELNANTDMKISEMNLYKDQLKEGYSTAARLAHSSGSCSLNCKLHVMHAEAGCELFDEGIAKTQCSIVHEIFVEGNTHNQSLQGSKNRFPHSKSRIPTLISNSYSRSREFRNMSKLIQAPNEDDVEKCTLENSHSHDNVQSGGKGQAHVGSCQAEQGQILNSQYEGHNNGRLNEDTHLAPGTCSEYKNKTERNGSVCETECAERNVEKCFAESSNILLSRTDVFFSAVQYYVVPQVAIRVEDEECTNRQNKIKENVSTFFDTQFNETHDSYSNGVKLDYMTDPVLDLSQPVPSCRGEENPELVGGSDLLQSSLECLLEMLLQRGKVIQAVVANIDGDVIAKTANLELTARDMKGLACSLSSTYQGIAKLAVFNDVYTCFKHDHNSVLIGTSSTRMFVAQRGKQSIVVGFTDPHTPGSCIKEIQEISRLLHKRGL